MISVGVFVLAYFTFLTASRFKNGILIIKEVKSSISDEYSTRWNLHSQYTVFILYGMDVQ